MEEQERKHKRRAGLHKEISSIFEGVPIPRNDGSRQPSGGPAPEGGSRVPGRPEQPPGPSPTTAMPERPRAVAAVKTTSRKQGAWQRIKNKLFRTKQGVSPTRQKMMVLLVPILFIVLVYKIYPVFKKPPGEMVEPGKATPTRIAAGTSAGKIDWQIPEPYPTTLRDPTESQLITTTGREPDEVETREPSRVEKLVVKGIVHSPDKPSAVVGTKIVHEGDKVAGATVVKINIDSVDFEMNGKKWTQKVER